VEYSIWSDSIWNYEWVMAGILMEDDGYDCFYVDCCCYDCDDTDDWKGHEQQLLHARIDPLRRNQYHFENDCDD